VETRGEYDFDSLAGQVGNLGTLAHRFDSEPRDPGWASRAIDTVSYELQSQPVYSQLTGVDVDCRDTLCRIEATIPIEALQATQNNGTGWVQVTSKLMTVPPWSTEFDNSADMESFDVGSGQAHLTTYLHRRHQGAVGYARTTS
jgi:hypothetical protein